MIQPVSITIPNPQADRAGFTLLEVLIAAGILAVTLTSTFALNSTVVKNTVFLADDLVATNLASEGLEIVRQIRDSRLIDCNPATKWNSWLQSGGQASSGTYGLKSQVVNNPCASGKINNSYLEPNSAETITVEGLAFTRKIELDLVSPSKVQVTSRVSWRFDNRDRQKSLSTVLADWKENS